MLTLIVVIKSVYNIHYTICMVTYRSWPMLRSLRPWCPAGTVSKMACLQPNMTEKLALIQLKNWLPPLPPHTLLLCLYGWSGSKSHVRVVLCCFVFLLCCVALSFFLSISWMVKSYTVDCVLCAQKRSQDMM